MKVLILGLNFSPEPVGVGKYTGDLVTWLAARGHQVRVITAPSYYPEWRLAEGEGRAYRRQSEGGIEILRCPLWVPRTPSSLRRILHLLSFALSSFLPCLWQAIRWRPDVVLAIEPTVLAAPAAWLAARLTGALACLHVQDLEIEAACSLQLIPHADLCRSARGLYAHLLRRFDLVSTISLRMRRRLQRLGVPSERLCRFPNWVDCRAIRPLAGASPLRHRLGLGADHVVVLYAGSMGEKQGLESLVEVADRLLPHHQVHLVLCGAGPGRARLERAMGTAPNVTWLPLQPVERLNRLLNLADIHILPQRPEVGDFVLPSKVGGILASGRPMVAQADGGELLAMAETGGIAVPPGNGAALVDAILTLAADPARRATLGRAARRLAERHLDRDLLLGRFERRLLAKVAARAAPRQAGTAALATSLATLPFASPTTPSRRS